MMKRFLSLLLIVLMIIAVAGCSGAQDEGKVEEEKAVAEKSEEEKTEATKEQGVPEKEFTETLDINAFYQIEEVKDVITNFKELEYVFFGGDGDIAFTYKLLGQDTVDGKRVDHVAIGFTESDGTESKTELWIDDDGSFLKAIMDGEELGPFEAPLVGMSMMMALIPFTTYSAGWEDAFLEHRGYEHLGWVITDTAEEQRDFGSGSITVHQYFFNVKDIATNRELKYSIEAAEIEGRGMFVGWETELENDKAAFKVNRLIPR